MNKICTLCPEKSKPLDIVQLYKCQIKIQFCTLSTQQIAEEITKFHWKILFLSEVTDC